jgi:hypothetical protein
VSRASSAQVQVRAQWGEPDDQPRHALAAGLGSEVGFGLRYTQFTPGSPWAPWVAAGLLASGAGCDLSLPTILFRRPAEVRSPAAEGFVSLGLTVEYADVPHVAGTGFAALGYRRWVHPRRLWFWEVSVGVNQHLWGDRPWGGYTGFAGRLQWGTTF